MSKFTIRLLAWYNENKRDLPWRDHPDPYAVWVSEIMLQQTRVEAVVPYFQRWMARFPTVAALAAASEQDVLQAWEGLGYYSRARNLRLAAGQLVEEHHGLLPRDPALLRKLPGIGRYTAGAIASMAFGLDEPALDGNIRRVLARVFNVCELADSPSGQKILWDLAARHVPNGKAGDYNQALMDLGATICVPRSPRCSICPLSRLCEAKKLGIQEERPVLKPKGAVPHHIVAAAVIEKRGRVLLARRPSKGLLGGMWEFPNGRVRGAPRRALASIIRSTYDLNVVCGEALGTVEHGYSHFGVTVHAFRCAISNAPKSSSFRWIRVKELPNYPMGRIDRQIALKLR